PFTPSIDFPALLAPGDAFFSRSAGSVPLQLPDPALDIYYYHQVHLGSSAYESDALGNLVAEIAYYPFCVPRFENQQRGSNEPYKFSQKERDRESGLEYFEARYLAPHLARFTRVDPLVTSLTIDHLADPQRINPYSYTGNNPLSRTDV